MRFLSLRKIIPMATVFAWAVLWKNTQVHWLGDTVIARWFHYSGQWFVDHGWESFGLPMYPNFGMAYTHITSGPDWLQGLIALTRPSSSDQFVWHSIVTAALSLFCLWIGVRALERISAAWNGLTPSRETTSTVEFLLLTSAAIQVFSPQPYLTGVIVAEVANLWIVSRWCLEPDTARYGRWLFGAAFGVALSFWMGLSTIFSSALWFAFAAYRFGDPKLRSSRIKRLVATLVFALVVSALLKLWQNYAYLGSWNSLMIDTFGALRARLGFGSSQEFDAFIAARGGLAIEPEYNFLKHVVKMFLRMPYLFGTLAIAVPVLLWKLRESLRAERVAIGLVVGAGIAWQVMMRHHAYHHIYLLRHLMFPLALLAMILIERAHDKKLLKRLALAGWAQLLLLWICLIFSYSAR